MSVLAIATGVFGGLGLFLLGMAMMTEGLRLAAGPALRRVLAVATRSRGQALATGILLTSLVQSSSAVTVAAIGFVNAGLLSLGGAIWVLFGANVGTTMTGWIVALIGLKFSIESLALPLLGLGAMLRLGGGERRAGAFGTALAGFGLLFLGIASLQEGFGALTSRVALPQGSTPAAVLAQLGIGMLLTVMMQSSSASIVVALTAAQTGLIPAQGAAAVVIGANLGTTVTAVFAAIGATANARRTAAAHVAFNLLTAVVAMLMLPWLVRAIATLQVALQLPADAATQLALFHSAFNLLGVILMWPLADRLQRMLQARFRAGEDDRARPRYLDDTLLEVPTLAVDALAREVRRYGAIAVELLDQLLDAAPAFRLQAERAALEQLELALNQFIERIGRSAMHADNSRRLAQVLRAQRAFTAVTEQAMLAARVEGGVADDLGEFRRHLKSLLVFDEPADAPRLAARRETVTALESAYESLKERLLQRAATGQLSLPDMERQLRWLGAMRTAAQQADKAMRGLAAANADAGAQAS